MAHHPTTIQGFFPSKVHYDPIIYDKYPGTGTVDSNVYTRPDRLWRK